MSIIEVMITLIMIKDNTHLNLKSLETIFMFAYTSFFINSYELKALLEVILDIWLKLNPSTSFEKAIRNMHLSIKEFVNHISIEIAKNNDKITP
jgi:hypothetical protein